MSENSTEFWRFVVVVSKFFILVIDAGLAKSFGVLIPSMVVRYETDFKSMAFICSLPATCMYFTGKNKFIFFINCL